MIKIKFIEIVTFCVILIVCTIDLQSKPCNCNLSIRFVLDSRDDFIDFMPSELCSDSIITKKNHSYKYIINLVNCKGTATITRIDSNDIIISSYEFASAIDTFIESYYLYIVNPSVWPIEETIEIRHRYFFKAIPYGYKTFYNKDGTVRRKVFLNKHVENIKLD